MKHGKIHSDYVTEESDSPSCSNHEPPIASSWEGGGFHESLSRPWWSVPRPQVMQVLWTQLWVHRCNGHTRFRKWCFRLLTSSSSEHSFLFPEPWEERCRCPIMAERQPSLVLSTYTNCASTHWLWPPANRGSTNLCMNVLVGSWHNIHPVKQYQEIPLGPLTFKPRAFDQVNGTSPYVLLWSGPHTQAECSGLPS